MSPGVPDAWQLKLSLGLLVSYRTWSQAEHRRLRSKQMLGNGLPFWILGVPDPTGPSLGVPGQAHGRVSTQKRMSEQVPGSPRQLLAAWGSDSGRQSPAEQRQEWLEGWFLNQDQKN